MRDLLRNPAIQVLIALFFVIGAIVAVTNSYARNPNWAAEDAKEQKAKISGCQGKGGQVRLDYRDRYDGCLLPGRKG